MSRLVDESHGRGSRMSFVKKEKKVKPKTVEPAFDPKNNWFQKALMKGETKKNKYSRSTY